MGRSSRNRGLGLVVALMALVAAPAAASQDAPTLPSKPIPYTSLVKRTRRPAPKPYPKPAAPAVAAPAVAAPGAPSAPPPASILSTAPPLPTAAPAKVAPPAPAPKPPPALPATQLPLAAAPAAAVSPAGARFAPGAPIPAAELEAFVDGAVRQAMARDHVAGVAVAVVQGGQVALEKGYGLARTGPQASAVDPRATRFQLGSVSKALTWIAVLRAVEAGRMTLDAPIDGALPPALHIPSEHFAEPVRLRHLMAHSAGFEAREFGRFGFTDEGRVRPLEETLARARPRRVRAPGELPTYSNYGAALAGEAWARTTGKPFDDAIEAGLLRPLGLASTTFREAYAAREGLPAPMDAALAARLARGYRWTGRSLQAAAPAFATGLAPALSASASADDMARLMLTILADGHRPGDGAAVWGPRAAAALRTTLGAGAPGLNGWAHGLMEFSLPGGFTGFGHEGATPAFAAKFITVPQLGLGVFVATNTDSGAALAHRLPEAIAAHFYGPAPTPPVAAPLEHADDYTGLYLSTRRAYHGLEGFIDRLTRLATVSADGDGRLVVADDGGGRRWRYAGAPGRFVSDDDVAEPLAFLMDPDGRAHSLLDPGGMWAAERVDALHRPVTLAASAVMALTAALLTLAGLFVRNAREYRSSRRQTLASRVQTAGATLWVAAAGAFAGFVLTARPAALHLNWPDPWLVAASVLALASAVLTVVQLVQLLGAWADDRRMHGWSAGRKARHTLSVLLFSVFSFVLLAWGALEPWSS